MAGSTALIAKQAWIIDSLNARFPGRGLWDYLDVFLVPILVFVLSIVIDWRGRARAEAQSKEAERIRSEKSMDQALESYFDRISAIMLDKQVLSLEQAATWRELPGPFLESAREVIRARTLSILRLFSQDVERKRSVILFFDRDQHFGKPFCFTSRG